MHACCVLCGVCGLMSVCFEVWRGGYECMCEYGRLRLIRLCMVAGVDVECLWTMVGLSSWTYMYAFRSI